jgi:hypothetical protein
MAAESPGRRAPSLPSGLRGIALGLAAIAVAGCFTVDASLNADGSGRMELHYIPGEHATVDSETARFTSPHVTVHSLKPEEVGAVLDATFDDVTKLSTAEGFRLVTVRRKRKPGQEQLRIVIRNPKPKPFKDDGKHRPHITLTLPGRVLGANRDARVAGNRVVWDLPLGDFVERPSVALGVAYAAAGAGDGKSR